MFSRIYTKSSYLTTQYKLISRTYATDSNLLNKYKKQFIKYSRTSTYDPRANELIDAIREKNYQHACKLVKTLNVNVNGHNKGENTPLTDCAKRGDFDGLKFLIKELGANPHSSCDCPDHKTSLHYAIEYGNYEAAKLLLALGADPNVMDKRGNTALNYLDKKLSKLFDNEATRQKKNEMRLLLENYGAKYKNQIEKEKEFIYLPKN